MKRAFLLLLIIVLSVPFFASCRQENPPERIQFDAQNLCGTYLRGNDFSISLAEDGSFSYYESPIGSHIGLGNYTFENGIVTLTETRQTISLENPEEWSTKTVSFRFRYTGNSLIYLADTSDQFIYINLPDQAEFVRSEKGQA